MFKIKKDMFDDNQRPAPGPPGSNQGQGGFAKPTAGQRPDMPSFEREIPQATPPEPPNSQVEDIFSDTDKPGMPESKHPIFQLKEPTGQTAGPASGMTETRSNFQFQRAFALIVMVAVLALIGWGGWFAFNKFFKFSVPEIDIDNIKEDVQDKIPDVPATINKVLDSDQDGLSDAEEKKLGTDIYNVDTDGDGLFDREEVKVYKTDPLNEDSDGDGYSDGWEVKNGYNPLGAGVLFDRGQPAEEPEKPAEPETPENLPNCPAVCTDLWEIRDAGCVFNECGSGCGADGLTSFDSEVECLRLYNKDSDNDGLTDREELFYGTDIDNPDTDADGYLDGQEVKNGFNPNGPGKL